MSTTSNKKLHNPPELYKPKGYSHVAEVTGGKLVFIAGQIAYDNGGNLVGKGDFEAQVRQVFKNLNFALAAAGATFQDVVKTNCYCADTVDIEKYLPVFRSIRDSCVNTLAPPVNSFVIVRRLVNPDWLIEVEAVAVVAN